MSTQLDLYDIQGNIVKAYGRFGYPKGRFVFYQVTHPARGREFVRRLQPAITTSAPWKPNASPSFTLNIGFTYQGLRHLGVPEQTLHAFPSEFSMGMKARRDILGDKGPSAPRQWDPIWQLGEQEQIIHLLIAINAKTPEGIDDAYRKICDFAAEQNGVVQLTGHKDEHHSDLPYQDAALLLENGNLSPKEHFGYTDGISETYFNGAGSDPSSVIGGGKPTGRDPRTPAGWAPIETGEFLLGYKDEASEYPRAPGPPLFARNGTYMVYRKLHQNVGSFKSYINEAGLRFPGGSEALAAKFVGRWANGAPLTTFPTKEEADRFIAELAAAEALAKKDGTPAAQARYAELSLKLVAFHYNDDLDGSRCPRGAHTRRANPRGSLEFGKTGAFGTPGALSNRRRLLRRGLPYGEVKDPTRDDGNHGIILMLLNADISRQFEFVQQQWMNFGNDFKLANDRDPILGNHNLSTDGRGEGRMIIEGDAAAGRPPYFCSKIPTFVETRGGDYFFIPSMTCLRMIAAGLIDPT